MKKIRVIFGLLFVAILSRAVFGGDPVMEAKDAVPVRWSRSIYAPSFGLDDDRTVTRQSEFSDLYDKWQGTLQFRLYVDGSSTGELVSFGSCEQLKSFLDSKKMINWETDLDRFRFWIQASNCNAWKIMPMVVNSRESFLPNLTSKKDRNFTKTVELIKELSKKLSDEKDQLKNDFLRDFSLSKDREISCALASECSSDIQDDYGETYIFNIVGQGDYNKDGINDFLVSIFAPEKKGGYAGLVITREALKGHIQVLAEY